MVSTEADEGPVELRRAQARTAVEVAAYQEPHAVRGETAQDTAVDLGVALLKCATRSDELKSEGSGAALASHALVATPSAHGWASSAWVRGAADSAPLAGLLSRAQRSQEQPGR